MKNSVTSNVFQAEAFLSPEVFDGITDLRIRRPGIIETEARRRKRRARLTKDGRLVLVAVDHPARGVTRIRDDELAMGDRYQLLARVRCLLTDPDVDGVLGSRDILEELLLISHLERRSARRSFLDHRLLVGSMNRGGLAGSAFEMEDTFTSITAPRLAQLRCDGGKMLYRFDAADPASGRTILACAEALNALRRYRLAAFLEPLAVTHRGEGYDIQKDAGTLIRQCGIAAALGESSSHVWLKSPYCDDLARVGSATTLPILLLGGPAAENPALTLRDVAAGLAASVRIRGAMIGRNLLFPSGADPLPVCRALTSIVHRGASVEAALSALESQVP